VTVDTPVTVDAGAILVTAPALVIPADKTIPAGTPVGSFPDPGGADPVSAYDNSFVRFPGADADTPLAMVRNGNSFTLETDVDTTFVGSGNLVQAGNYTVVIVEAGGNVGSATGTISVTGTALTQ